jgi:hypothetical protein
MKTWLDRLLRRGAPQPAPSIATRPAPRVNAYQAVQIRPCARPCPAAREAAGARILARSAPAMPLRDCDRPAQCTCSFRKFDDRRDGPQRNPYASELVRAWPGQERRTSRGRRRGDR